MTPRITVTVERISKSAEFYCLRIAGRIEETMIGPAPCEPGIWLVVHEGRHQSRHDSLEEAIAEAKKYFTREG